MATGPSGSWLDSDAPRGAEYDQQLAARLAGQDAHGEARFVEAAIQRLLPDAIAPRLLDGGCGTGRVGIELAARGFHVTGVDLDPGMLEVARQKAPNLDWLLSDLAAFRPDRPFDVAVLAGNVMIFVGHGHEAAVVANLATVLAPGALLIAGFQLKAGRLALDDYDHLCTAAGLVLVERWSTWNRDPWSPAADYAVSVHRLCS
jgi:SAM-dependent methyltransferase